MFGLAICLCAGAAWASTVELFEDRELRSAALAYDAAVYTWRSGSESPRDRWIAAWYLQSGLAQPLLETHLIDTESIGPEPMFAYVLNTSIEDPLILLRTITALPAPDEAQSEAASTLRERLPAQAQALDPDNLHVWLLSLPDPEDADSAPQAKTLLARAAGSSSVRSGMSELLPDLLRGALAVPLPEVVSQAQFPYSMDPQDAPLPGRLAPFFGAIGIWTGIGMPNFSRLTRWCRQAQAIDASDDCARIGSLLMEHGDTLLDRMVGAAIHRSLPESVTKPPQWLAQCRGNAWLAESFTQVSITEDEAWIDALQAAWLKPDADEISAIRALLSAAGRTLTPPEDYSPECAAAGK